jgi:hypothetical protein
MSPLPDFGGLICTLTLLLVKYESVFISSVSPHFLAKSLIQTDTTVKEEWYALSSSEDAFVITCTDVKVLYVQQDLRYEISSYWRFNV